MTQRAHSKSGQITIIFVAGLLTFLGMLSLTVDVGYYYATKAQLQAAADVALLSAFARVQPFDPFEKQEQSLRESIAQFENANLGPDGVMGVPRGEERKDFTHLFTVKAYMDPSSKSLIRAEVKTVYEVGTNFARIFGQDKVSIGVYSAVEGGRVNRRGQDVMAAHLVE